MKKLALAGAWVCMISLPLAANAGIKKAKRPAVESYAATEEETDESPTLRQGGPGRNTPSKAPLVSPVRDVRVGAAAAAPASSPRAPLPPPPLTEPMPATAKPSTLLSSVAENYDAVPADQTDSLVRRLRIVEALIVKHGRAYDYRMHTVRELQAALTGLETATERRVSARSNLRSMSMPAEISAPTPVQAKLNQLPEPIELDAVSPEDALEFAAQN